ncbi:hypothetical protein [Mesorhizobium sp. GR13]|uniref:hypothetical protein n=1 Tax=Mesorhizobium sp. GR13 TaxID=2562308 RepID=UPI0010C13053|nr:hypothetical protein [Mesorhizobium sp. GR13]
MKITSESIRHKIQALDVKRVELDQQFEDLSVTLLVGEAEAGPQIAEVQTQIDRLAIERKILEKGLKRAYEVEAEALEKDRAARRGGAIKKARGKAVQIVAAGKKADDLINQIKDVFEELKGLEEEIHGTLFDVRAMPTDARVGRRDLPYRLLELLNAYATGKLMFMGDQRGVEALALDAWTFLLEEDADDEQDEAA